MEIPYADDFRALMFHRDSNGFASCVKRIGRKVYIDEDAFFRWVEKVAGIAWVRVIARDLIWLVRGRPA